MHEVEEEEQQDLDPNGCTVCTAVCLTSQGSGSNGFTAVCLTSEKASGINGYTVCIAVCLTSKQSAGTNGCAV
jgi:hypothetical protein